MAARFDPLVGAMRSRDGEEFNVIIDSLTKPRLLWWAVKAGGPARYDAIARAHALTIARDHVRPDGSTVHAAFYDPATGALKRVDKGAAYADDSTWARGQAWAVLGFPAAYRETRDPRFLEVARLVSDWWLRHVPDDMVPYWDFGAPDIPPAPRDTSAAAIAASGLIDLALLDPDEERRAAYAGAARETLASLMSPAYSSATWTPSVLLHGTYSWWMDITDRGLAYGDAFFLEALLRLRRLSPEEPPLPVVTARSATGVPSAAIDGSLSTSWAARGPQSIDLRLRRHPRGRRGPRRPRPRRRPGRPAAHPGVRGREALAAGEAVADQRGVGGLRDARLRPARGALGARLVRRHHARVPLQDRGDRGLPGALTPVLRSTSGRRGTPPWPASRRRT